MDFKFSKNSSNTPQDATDDKKKQSALLVLLLILVGGFTYIYFFTGLIKPQETPKNAVPTPAVKTEVAKIPLPVRDGEPAKPDAKVAEKGAAVVSTAPVATPTVAKPVPAPTAKPTVATPKVAPVVKAVGPKEEPKKAEVKPTDKKPLPVAVVKNEDKKPLSAAKKSAETTKKAGAKKPAVETQAKTDTEAKPKKEESDQWTIIVGNYVLEEALSADMGRIRKAGFQPVVKASTRKKSTMNRLLVAEFSDRAAAQPTLDKLKQQTSDAFVIEQGGKFAVIAGSYLQTEAAQSEKERLQGAGFAVTIKQIDIAIPSQTLSVGSFTGKKAADSALAKLKNSGIKASLSQK